MDADRKVVARGGFEDRPVPLASKRLDHLGGELHLHKIGVAGAALDLRDRRFRVFVRHRDSGAQPRIAPHPMLHLPFVQRGAERRAEIGIAGGAAVQPQRREDAIGDVVGIEVLRLHEGQVGARQRATRRPSVAAGSVGRRLRIVGAAGERQPCLRAECCEMALPAQRQPRVEVRGGAHGRVDVAIDDALPRLCGPRPLQRRRAHAHCIVSFSRG